MSDVERESDGSPATYFNNRHSKESTAVGSEAFRETTFTEPIELSGEPSHNSIAKFTPRRTRRAPIYPTLGIQSHDEVLLTPSTHRSRGGSDILERQRCCV